MKTISRFVNALGTLFRATDIGAFFAPLFRPMVREQDRLHLIRVVPSQDRPPFARPDSLQRERANP